MLNEELESILEELICLELWKTIKTPVTVVSRLRFELSISKIRVISITT
jgi:hypothetical protein